MMKRDLKMLNNRYFVKNRLIMNTAHVRKRIHEYVDKADERFLSLVNGMIEADNGDWWDNLHPNLQASIDRAIAQSAKGEGRPHKKVMDEIRSKYTN